MSAGAPSKLGPRLALLVIGALAGCVPKLEKPELSVIGVSLERGTLFEQHLRVRMHVQNPNRRALVVKSLDYRLEVGTELLAQGNSVQAFTVPALGETEFDMSVTTDMAGALLRILGSHADALDYHLIGKVTLSEGFSLTIPFDQHGTFKLR
jgi:LEA14-like dessication related protein